MLSTNLSTDLIKALKEDSRFQEFTEYVLDKIDELDTAQGLEDKSNSRAGEEIKVRSKTVKAIKLILQPFIDFTEKKAPTDDQINKTKRRFGL